MELELKDAITIPTKPKTVHEPPPKAYQNPKYSIITELQSKEDEQSILLYSDNYKYNPKNFVEVNLIARNGEDSFFSNKTGKTINQTTHNITNIRDLNLSDDNDSRPLRGTTS